MTDDTSAPGARASDNLYEWWFSALPALFPGSAPAANAERSEPPADAAAAPFPAGDMSHALKLTQGLLNTLYGGYFQALMARKPGEELRSLEALLQGQTARLADKLTGWSEALGGHPDFKALLPGLAGAAMSTMADALKPLSTNLERAYGGLADAFGLAPLRGLEAAGRDMAAAALAHRRAQAEYLELALVAAGKGIESLIARLAEMGERGESVETMLALVRLFAKTMDASMHEAMQSPRALQTSADLIRAAARSRQQQQRVVAIASEALNVPTRAEVDAAYREIQELKRELRQLRKAVTAAASATPVAAVTAVSVEPTVRRTRKNAS